MIKRNGLVIAMTVLLVGAVISPAQAANKSGGPVKLPKPRQQLVARNTLVQKIRLLREQGTLGWLLIV